MSYAEGTNETSESFKFQVYCPSDKWVSCDDELWDLSIYGSAYIHTYSGTQWIHNATVQHHLNSCGYGKITRTFKARDYSGRWHKCTQTIWVESGGTRYPDIWWPKQDLVLDQCDPYTNPDWLPTGYGRPTIENRNDCSSYSISYDDKEFRFQGGCKKIIRTWTVMDWCAYQANQTGGYVWHYDQVIKIVNTDAPTVSVPEDVQVQSDDCNDAHVSIEPLKVINASCDNSYSITNNSPHANSNGADASGDYPVGNTIVTYTVHYGCGYKKTYKVNVTVKDNSTPLPICIALISLPLTGIDTDGDGVNDQGSVTIWAKDFDHKSETACGSQNLRWSFSKDDIVMSREFTCDDMGVNEIPVYVFADNGNYSYCTVYVTIQNNAANIEDCEIDGGHTADDHDDTTGDLPGDSDADDDPDDTNDTDYPDTGGARIAGTVSIHYDEAPVADVEIALTMDGNEQILNYVYDTTITSTIVDSFLGGGGFYLYVIDLDTSYTVIDSVLTTVAGYQGYSMTDAEGAYAFASMPMESSMSLDASKESYGYQEVDDYDAKVLYDHLFTTEKITDPYALIAADMDGSGIIDINDLSVMLNLLSGVMTEEENMSFNPWVFVPADYTFTDASNPWGELESIQHQVDSLDASILEVDFIAIRRGDIKNSELGTRSNDILSDIAVALGKEPTLVIQGVSPNPFSELLRFDLSSSKDENINIKLFDLQGKLLLSKRVTISAGQQTIEVQSQNILISGMMLYRVETSTGHYKGKVIKL